MENLNPFLNSL